MSVLRETFKGSQSVVLVLVEEATGWLNMVLREGSGGWCLQCEEPWMDSSDGLDEAPQHTVFFWLEPLLVLSSSVVSPRVCPLVLLPKAGPCDGRSLFGLFVGEYLLMVRLSH